MSDYDDLPLFSLDLDESVEPEIAVRPELLTIKLFRQAIQEAEGNQEDVLLQRFAEYVLPNLMRQLVGTTAKGANLPKIVAPRVKMSIGVRKINPLHLTC